MAIVISTDALAISPVPGEKIDHNGLVINPTPQNIVFTEGTVDFSRGFNPEAALTEIFALVPSLERNADGLKIEAEVVNMGLNGNANSNNASNSSTINPNQNNTLSFENGLANKSGAYIMNVEPEGVKIRAYDQRGLFYALQSLRQIAASANDLTQIPAILITDYPTLNDRGVVEGFYGNPWSHSTRLSLIDFFGANKLNVYIYGPKDDPYHNCPDWRLPYPENEAVQIKELVDACQRNYVDFVWAIHPGQDYKWNQEDYELLIAKLQSMYDLGVRRFALFFDDINGEGTNPHLQSELLNRITEEFVKTHQGVYPLTICPSDYSMIWANPTENGALAVYGRYLDPQISVMWTGTVVCGDLVPSALQFINSRTKRPAYVWWNFPVQDYVREIILQGPVYGLYKNVTPSNVAAFVSNPMEHGHASKLALYSVADYTWNPLNYNALDSWERGLLEVEPQASEEYRRFAIHSCDTESGYRRDESWESVTFTLDQWTDSLAQALQQEFVLIENTPKLLREKALNTELVAELDPWLDEFAALGRRGYNVINLARRYRELPEHLDSQEAARFWKDYISLCMTEEQKASYAGHKVGTLKLQPFYQQMMEDMGKGFYNRLASGSGKEGHNVIRENEAAENENVPLTLSLRDGNMTTSYTLNGSNESDKIEIGVNTGTDQILILSGEKPSLTLIEVDSTGKILKKTPIKTPIAIISLKPTTTSVILSGKGEVFEIIM